MIEPSSLLPLPLAATVAVTAVLLWLIGLRGPVFLGSLARLAVARRRS